MSRLVSLLGGEHSSSKQPLKEVFEFEHKLAQVGIIYSRLFPLTLWYFFIKNKRVKYAYRAPRIYQIFAIFIETKDKAADR